MSTLRQIFSILTKREKRQVIVLFGIILVQGFVELLGIGSIAPFMTVISNPDLIETNTYFNWAYEKFHFLSHRDFIVSLGLVVIGLLTLGNFCRGGVSFLLHFYFGRSRHSIETRMIKKYLGQSYGFFLNINTARISSQVLNEVEAYVYYILEGGLRLLSSVVIALLIVGFLVAMNPLIALIVTLVLCTAYGLLFFITSRYLSRKGKERTENNTLRFKYVAEAFGGIKDLKLLGREGVFLKQFIGASKKCAMNDISQRIVSEIPKYILEIIAFGGILGMIIIMLGSGKQIDAILPLVAVYAIGGYRLLPALQKVFSFQALLRYYMPMSRRLNRDYQNLADFSEDNGGRANETFPTCSTEVVLKDINFRYPNTQEKIVKNQSLKIRANTSVGIVGATGCGKTTIIDIILGLLEPQSGSIFVDGVEITKKNIKNWQSLLGYVPQSIFLIDDTVGKNIAFGIPEEEIDDEAIVQAAKIANIHDFVQNNLERGYDTLVGERGIRLSGGQRQRIGIARAVYHNPSVLILDEATSALDGVTEDAIMDAIHNLSHKKTIIMIAHRLTTVRECDEIFLMEEGAILGHGSYEELLAKNETFRKMNRQN